MIILDSDIMIDLLHQFKKNLFAIAFQPFIQKYENKELLQKINQVYDDIPDPTEERLQAQFHHHQPSLLEKW